MSTISPSVNPHPVPDDQRLAQITDETLKTLIDLQRSSAIHHERLTAAGVPTLRVLAAELLRREKAGVVVLR
jgi:hypothetical protein